MTKNIATETTKNDAVVTAESLVADAAKDNLVKPSVPAQPVAEEKKPADEFNTEDSAWDVDDQKDELPKFHAVVADRANGEVHEFDSVGTLLKFVTIRAFKSRKVQVVTGAVVTAGAAAWAVTRKKAAEIVEETLDETDEDSIVLQDAPDTDA
jgi:hypothetical protein